MRGDVSNRSFLNIDFFCVGGSPFGALLVSLVPFWIDFEHSGFNFERYCLHFKRSGLHFERFGLHVCALGSIFEVLKPTLRPTTPRNICYSVPDILASVVPDV